MRRYTEEEKIEILKEVENLGNVSLVAKKHGTPSTTIQNWSFYRQDILELLEKLLRKPWIL